MERENGECVWEGGREEGSKGVTGGEGVRMRGREEGRVEEQEDCSLFGAYLCGNGIL